MHGQDQGVTDHASILERGQHRIYCARLSNELCGALGNNSLSLVRLAHSPSTGPDVACGHHQRPAIHGALLPDTPLRRRFGTDILLNSQRLWMVVLE